MSRERANEPISPAIRQIVDFFRVELPEVTFPMVDVATLDELAAAVLAQSLKVEEARAALAVARTALEDSQKDLLERCELGLSYLEVYAQGNPQLEEKLSKLSLDKQTAKRVRRRSVTARARKNGEHKSESFTELAFPDRPKVFAELPFGDKGDEERAAS